MGEHAGRKALVTGGSRGIGRAVVAALLDEGADVAFSYQGGVSRPSVVSTVGKSGHGRLLAFRAHLAKPDEIVALFDAVQRKFGGLDIVINNAGVVRLQQIKDATDDDFAYIIDNNVRGTFTALRESLRRISDGGRIVNVSSINTVFHGPRMGLYSASKGAIEQLTIVASKEVGHRGVTVNAVLPGGTDTDMLHSVNTESEVATLATMSALSRIADPDDIANVIMTLIGPRGSWITGQLIRATGGFM